uniref:Uncharacterized protein n=2 Tax=Brassica TaxID=3705 RepID=A0A0D3BK33_BRAOL
MEPVMTFSKDRNVVGDAFSKKRNTRDDCGKTFSQRWYIFWTVTRVTEIIFYYALHPLPKYPQRNHNYKVWSKGRERQQEDSLGAACNDIDRLIAGISSVIEVKPKKDDGKEKSGAVVKEASWIDLYLPEEARGYAKLARLDKPIRTWLFAWSYMWSIALAADPGSLPSWK